MTQLEEQRRPLLTCAIVIVFLVANAQRLEVAAWGLALAYAAWALWTRYEEPGVPRALLSILAVPCFLLMLGLPGFYLHPLADFSKDCWYFAGPIVYLAFGFLVAEKLPSIRWVVYLFSVAGTIVSVSSLWTIYHQGSLLLAAATAEDYRHLIGTGAGQSMIPAVLIVMCREAKVDLGLLDRHKWLRYTILGIGLLATTLALSRMLLFVLLAGMAICAGRKLLIFALVAGTLVLVVPEFIDVAPTAAAQSFMDKIAHGGQEVEVHSYSSMSQINDNWRGFEGYRGLKTYTALPPIQQLVGGGFGTLVDLGFQMNLGGPTEIQEVPILHNGYLYLLVKTGIVGVGLFLFYVFTMLRKGYRLLHEGVAEQRLCGYVFVWCAITFLLTQGVITGIYNKGALAPNLILLGIAAATMVSVQSEVEAESAYDSTMHGLTPELTA